MAVAGAGPRPPGHLCPMDTGDQRTPRPPGAADMDEPQGQDGQQALASAERVDALRLELKQATRRHQQRTRLSTEGARAAETALLSLGDPSNARTQFGRLFARSAEATKDSAEGPPLLPEEELAEHIVSALNVHKGCFIPHARGLLPGRRGAVWHWGKQHRFGDDSLASVLAAAFEHLKAQKHADAFDAVADWLKGVTPKTSRAGTSVVDRPEGEAVTRILRDALRLPPERREEAITAALAAVVAGAPSLFERRRTPDLEAVLAATVLEHGVDWLRDRLRSPGRQGRDAVDLLSQAIDKLADGTHDDARANARLTAFMRALVNVAGVRELQGLPARSLSGVAAALRAPELRQAVAVARGTATGDSVYRALVEGLQAANAGGASPEAMASALALTLRHNNRFKRHDLLGAAYWVLVVQAQDRPAGALAFQRFAERAVLTRLVRKAQHVDGTGAQRRAAVAIMRAACDEKKEHAKFEMMRRLFVAVNESHGVVDRHVLRGAFWRVAKDDTAWLYARVLGVLVPRKATDFGRYGARLRALAGHRFELRRGEVGNELPRWGWRPRGSDPDLFDRVSRLLAESLSNGHAAIAAALAVEVDGTARRRGTPDTDPSKGNVLQAAGSSTQEASMGPVVTEGQSPKSDPQNAQHADPAKQEPTMSDRDLACALLGPEHIDVHGSRALERLIRIRLKSRGIRTINRPEFQRVLDLALAELATTTDNATHITKALQLVLQAEPASVRADLERQARWPARQKFLAAQAAVVDEALRRVPPGTRNHPLRFGRPTLGLPRLRRTPFSSATERTAMAFVPPDVNGVPLGERTRLALARDYYTATLSAHELTQLDAFASSRAGHALSLAKSLARIPLRSDISSIANGAVCLMEQNDRKSRS